MNYSGYFIDKDGNKYLPYKELNFSFYHPGGSLDAVVIKGLEIGGIYEVAISYRHNPGFSHYRSTIFAILTINCGYNTSTQQVVVRPKLDIISNYRGASTETDTKVEVVCEGGGKERAVSKFLNEKQVYIFMSKESSSIILDNFKIKIRKIN